MVIPAFEERVRTFVRLADVDGTRSTDNGHRDRRDVSLVQLPDGSWRLRGRLPAMAGAEINETFAHFIDAEFRSDLAEARERAGGSEPDNGLPLCKRHNLHKEHHRCTAHSDEHGEWIIARPGGTPID